MNNIIYILAVIVVVGYIVFLLRKNTEKNKNTHIEINQKADKETIESKEIVLESNALKEEDKDFNEIGKNYRQKFLLTKNEYIFYLTLKKIADEEGWLICPKVDLKEIFVVSNKENYMAYFGRIAQKNVDFVICDSNLKPKYAIELDDNTHNKQDRQKNDRFKEELFKNSSIKLIRIKAQQSYTENYIGQYFKEK